MAEVRSKQLVPQENKKIKFMYFSLEAVCFAFNNCVCVYTRARVRVYLCALVCARAC